LDGFFSFSFKKQLDGKKELILTLADSLVDPTHLNGNQPIIIYFKKQGQSYLAKPFEWQLVNHNQQLIMKYFFLRHLSSFLFRPQSMHHIFYITLKRMI